MSKRRTVYFVMGPCACGKSTIGRKLADSLQVEFVDADDYHPQSNRDKLRDGIALTDDDRRPWLRELARLAVEKKESVVIACSALKQAYRDILVESLDKDDYKFIFLNVSSRFIHPSLLDDQLAILEPPLRGSQGVVYVDDDGTLNPEKIIDKLMAEISLPIRRSNN